MKSRGRIPLPLGEGLPLLAGAGLSLALLRSGPLPPGDPLRTTLAALPLVVAGLWWLRRWVGRSGGRLPSAAWRTGEGLAALALGLLIVGRGLLGLELADPLTVGAGLTLLAAHVARQVVAMRPLLGLELPRSPPLPFLLLPLLVYLAILPWSSGQRPPDGDEPWYLLLTHSIAYDFDIDLADNYAAGDWRHFMEREIGPQPGDPRGARGEIYSRHDPLLPLLLALPYRLAGKAGVLTTMAVLAAALAWTLLRLAHTYLPQQPGAALLAWSLIAFAPPLLIYSQQVWVEVPSALITALALERIRALGGERRQVVREWILCCLLIALLPALKLRFALIAVPLFGLALWHLLWHRRRRLPDRLLIPVGVVLALAAAALGALLLYNWRVYGNVLKMYSLSELALHRLPAADYLNRLVGLFWDGAFGLFASSPLWLLLVPAVFYGIARRSVLVRDVALLTLPYLLAVASRNEWYGGWSPPFRYGLATLPLLGLLLMPLLARRRGAGARALVAGLAAVTGALTLVWLVIPGWTYNFADGRSLLVDQLCRRLDADLLRFVPSAVHPRLATWVWPPLSSLVVVLFWWWPRRRWRFAPRAGTLLALAAMALLALLAQTLPTRRLELEAAQVEKIGGHPYPRRWIVERYRYRESWVLREGESLNAPIVAGGSEAELVLHGRFLRRRPGPVHLELLTGDRRIARLRLDESERWRAHRLGPLPWPPDADRLVLSLPPVHGSERRNGVVLDRLELHWRRSR